VIAILNALPSTPRPARDRRAWRRDPQVHGRRHPRDLPDRRRRRHCRRRWRAAAQAAEASLHAVGALSLSELLAGEPLRVGPGALHAGEVFYGNIGAADRLDFTVIGPGRQPRQPHRRGGQGRSISTW